MMSGSGKRDSGVLEIGALRGRMQCRRVRLLIVLLIALLSAVLLFTHSAPSMQHMDKATAVCLAVLSAGLASLLASPPWALTPQRLGFTAMRLLGPRTQRPPILASGPPSRAGPPVLQVFRR